MRRLPRPSVFQVFDSVLLGLATAAILTIIVHFVRDEMGWLDLRVYLVLIGSGFIAGVVTLAIGLGRGRDTVDGVFIGPAVRLFSILCFVCAIGTLALVSSAPGPSKGGGPTTPVPSVSDRCASVKEALARKLQEAISRGTFAALEDGPRVSLVQAARSVSRTCPSEEAGAALDNLRFYRDADAADEPEKTQDEATVAAVSYAAQGAVDDDSMVIGQPVSGNPPTVQVTVPEPVIPPAPIPDASDPGSNGDDPIETDPGTNEEEPRSDQPPQRTVTREYKLGLLPEILNQILGGIGFGFGGVKITTTEIQSALENEDVVEGGQALADTTAPLETIARAQLYWALIQAVTLDESVGGAKVETVASALKRDRALGMCFLVLSKTASNENLNFIQSMEGEIVNSFQAVKHELKEEVESCINELISDQANLQQAFSVLGEVYR
jgi:hypothetical protein